MYRVARRECTILVSKSEVTLGRANEANVGEPGVTPKVTPGFFVTISNVLHADGLVAETV